MTFDLRAGGEHGTKVGEISWPFGAPLVAVRDVFVPERVDAWGHFPGKPLEEPVLRMALEVRRGIPTFTRVELVAATGGVEISGAHLGLVRENLEWWRDMIVRNAAQRSAEQVQPGDLPGWDTLMAPDWADPDQAVDAVRKVRRGRPRKATDARHDRVAMIYRAHQQNPLEAIRDAYRKGDGEKISQRTAARYVAEAREAGALPPTTQGKRNA